MDLAAYVHSVAGSDVRQHTFEIINKMWNNLPLVAQIIYSMISLHFFSSSFCFVFVSFDVRLHSIRPFYSSLVLFWSVAVLYFSGVHIVLQFGYCFRHDDHMEIVPFFGQTKAIKRSQRAANYINGTGMNEPCHNGAHFVDQRNI